MIFNWSDIKTDNLKFISISRRKLFLIGIQSPRIRAITKSISNLFWTNPNNVLNPVPCKSVQNQYESIRLIPVQSESIGARISQNRISNLNYSDLGSIYIENVIRIHSDWSLGLNRKESDWPLFFKFTYQSKTKFESRSMQIGYKSIWLISVQFETSIRMNLSLNWFKTNSQSESFWPWIHSDSFGMIRK